VRSCMLATAVVAAAGGCGANIEDGDEVVMTTNVLTTQQELSQAVQHMQKAYHGRSPGDAAAAAAGWELGDDGGSHFAGCVANPSLRLADALLALTVERS